MRKLFGVLFLTFWLPLIAVALLLLAIAVWLGFSRGSSYQYLIHMTIHDLLLFTFAGVVFCYLISRYLTKPLDKLSSSVASIAEGHLETRVDRSLINRRDEIGDLAHNFDRMAERLEALITQERQLLGDISHELRSPLARLTVALGLLKQGHTEEAPEHLERIALEARRLDTLIGQLLALTRIHSGLDRYAPAPFDLTSLVQEVASDGDFEARPRKRSVVLKTADLCVVNGIEELVRSAVENVVRNAIRYTAEGTAVEISLVNDGGRAIIRVKDYGPGVPTEMLSEIFLPFRRVASDDMDGAGLGLAIAERAIHVHRGTIRASNASNGGLVMEIDVPK